MLYRRQTSELCAGEDGRVVVHGTEYGVDTVCCGGLGKFVRAWPRLVRRLGISGQGSLQSPKAMFEGGDESMMRRNGGVEAFRESISGGEDG